MRDNSDLSGKRFGRLTVVRKIDLPGKAKYQCVCDCGNTTIVRGDSLKCGDSQSCGCFLKERLSESNTVYPDKESKYLAKRFGRMMERCYCKTSPKYKDYGLRGIVVCDKWIKDPMSFVKWAKEHGLRKGLTIDRIDVNGPYSPSNCRVADERIQNNNKRNNHSITVGDSTKTLSEWGDELNFDPKHLYTKPDGEIEKFIELQQYEALVKEPDKGVRT